MTNNKLVSNSGNHLVYRNNTCLEHGSQAVVGASIYMNREKVKDAIQDIVREDDLIATIEKQRAIEELAYNSTFSAMQEWVNAAEITNTYQKALEWKNDNADYLSRPHTCNQWEEDEFRATISNRVYVMTCSVFNSRDRNGNDSYYASWGIFLNVKSGQSIAGQNNKKYKSEEEATRYIEGRVRAYSDLFSSVNPTIPSEHIGSFSTYEIPFDGCVFV